MYLREILVKLLCGIVLDIRLTSQCYQIDCGEVDTERKVILTLDIRSTSLPPKPGESW